MHKILTSAIDTNLKEKLLDQYLDTVEALTEVSKRSMMNAMNDSNNMIRIESMKKAKAAVRCADEDLRDLASAQTQPLKDTYSMMLKRKQDIEAKLKKLQG